MILTTTNNAFSTQNRVLQTTWKPSDMLIWLDSEKKFIDLDGSNVSVWRDKSGKNNHFRKITSAPTYSLNSLGFYSICFYNQPQRIISTRDLNINTYTIFTVFKSTINGLLYYYSKNLTESGFHFSTANNTIVTFNQNMGLLTAKQKGSNNLLNNWLISCHTYNGTHATHNLYKNNSLLSLTTYSGWASNFGDIAGNTIMNIGSKFDNSQGFNGEIAEIIVYNKCLTDTEISQINSYLNNKYHIY